ncbi:hypothetical protein WSM22_25290 [Cytophagales bacterium WSM2-2]|nr:hypothetical protein WSM22_25290 [Cytophagales bacterium WSM2-2]
MLISLSRAYRLAVPDSAVLFSKEAYDLAEKISYQKGIATALNFIGTAYFFKGDYPTAQEYQKKALAFAQLNRFDTQHANALNSLALAYQYQGNYFAALDSYLKALELEEKSRNYVGQVKVLANIGILWKKQGDYDNAINYYKQALQLSDSLKDSRLVRANINNNMGTVLIDQKKYNEAIDYFLKSMALNKELGNKVFIANCLGNIGLCYLNLKEFTLAEKNLKQSLQLAQDLKSNEYIELALLNLADVYLRLHQPAKALPLSKESLALSKKFNNKENILLNYRALASEYKELGQQSLAISFLEKALDLSDSLKSADLNKKIRDIQNSYELNKKESEISLLEKDAALKKSALKEEKILRYGLIGIVAGLCVFIGIVYYSFTTKASLSKKLQKQREEILRAQALRAQMNPHFIFNSLNSIQFLIMKVESTKAFDYLAKFGLLLRKIMDNSERDLISLSDEIEILKLYVELESLRFEDSFEYKIESLVEDETRLEIPPMVIQPYIENAILHGLMPKQGERKLIITFLEQNGSLLCEVRDNGIGRAEAMEITRRKNKIFASKGMQYTSERLQAMNKFLNGKSEINIFDLNDNGKATGTLVKIMFAYA